MENVIPNAVFQTEESQQKHTHTLAADLHRDCQTQQDCPYKIVLLVSLFFLYLQPSLTFLNGCVFTDSQEEALSPHIRPVLSNRIRQRFWLRCFSIIHQAQIGQ